LVHKERNPDTFGFEVSVVQRVAAGGRDGIIKACAKILGANLPVSHVSLSCIHELEFVFCWAFSC